jgi:hypothetical protein
MSDKNKLRVLCVDFPSPMHLSHFNHSLHRRNAGEEVTSMFEGAGADAGDARRWGWFRRLGPE